MVWTKISKKLILVLLLASFLRLWSLDKVPASLMFDELELGYHSYSILKTGKDYFGNPWPLHFKSQADAKSPLYIYTSVPTVSLFGISYYGVRLPSAIFGILAVLFLYLLVEELLRGLEDKRIKVISLLAALLLAISPWHLQYSRGAFEANLMLTLYLAGIYFFLRSLKEGKWLVLASLCLVLTTWAYATAKLFLPLTLLAILFIWWKDIFKIQKKYLVWSMVVFFAFGVPIAYSTFVGGATGRLSYTAVFTDPTVPSEADFNRLHDALIRGENWKLGLTPRLEDRVFHNKVASWGRMLVDNYLKTFSSEFLFVNGDLNLRHSPQGIGQLYKIEAIFLLIGLVFLFKTTTLSGRARIFLLFWLFASPLPSVITRDGGGHATRSLFLLPPLLTLVALGVYHFLGRVNRRLFGVLVALAYLVSFVAYQHTYWMHFPWDSERAWHSGWEEAIKESVAKGEEFEKVVITTADQPPLVFFLSWAQYPPEEFQQNFPLPEEEVLGFGSTRHLGKYFFGQPTVSGGLANLSSVLDDKTLYLAASREWPKDLILEPEKKPEGLEMVRAIPLPSGIPVFYLFKKSIN